MPFTCSTHEITGLEEYVVEIYGNEGKEVIPLDKYNSTDFVKSDSKRCPIGKFELILPKTAPADFVAFNAGGDIEIFSDLLPSGNQSYHFDLKASVKILNGTSFTIPITVKMFRDFTCLDHPVEVL